MVHYCPFNKLEIEPMFKPLSESEDIKQYISKVLKETKKSNKKLYDI